MVDSPSPPGSPRPSEQERLRILINDQIDKIKLTDVVPRVDVSGPSLVGATPAGPAIGWFIGVSLKHNMLLGQPDIMAINAVMGVLPSDDDFRQVAGEVLEQARKARDQIVAGG